jgi:molecular chaperone HtpG
MATEKGTISIHTENIFPIIKKFLYSDHDIFLRELVSNAVDATQKVKRLASMGEYSGELGDLTIDIKVNKKKKTITVSDKGIGMSAEEIKKYINQIAFSGATDFIEKFKEAGDAKEIIGKFGLGFYSAFMVAEKVEIITKSYKNEPAAHWICTGDTEFEIKDSKKQDRGTEIILHVSKEEKDFLEDSRISEILNRYCKFLPVPVRFGQKDESVEDGKDKDGNPKYKTVKVDNVINNTDPLWTKSPSELKDEDYLEFYKELYPFSEDPLFWIHLNVDYPFNLTGILYFPKVKNDFEVQKNKIQLYSRQVFITDEVKDVVPDFLQLLHGVIDSPDIPLNVSRSFLQADSSVKKINAHITKKVADKLSQLFKKDRDEYQKKWDDISIFVKYGIISEEKFKEKALDFTLLKTTDDEYFTESEFKEAVKDVQTDKDKNIVYLYTTDPGQQDTYIDSAKRKDYKVLVMDGVLDSHFINQMEQQNTGTLWKRVDADSIDKLVNKDENVESVLTEEQQNKIKEIFEKAINGSSSTVSVESLDPNEMPVSITKSEFMRRMNDMAKIGGGGFGMMGAMPDQVNVVVNGNHSLINKILKSKKEERKLELAKQSYDLALLSQNMLSGKDLTSFIKRSVDLASN